MSSKDGLYAFVNKASKNLFHLVFQLFPLSKNSKEYEKLTRDWVKASYKPNHDKSFVWRQFCNFPNWKLSYNVLYVLCMWCSQLYFRPIFLFSDIKNMALHNKKTCQIHDILFELTFRIRCTNKILTTYMYLAGSKIQQQ